MLSPSVQVLWIVQVLMLLFTECADCRRRAHKNAEYELYNSLVTDIYESYSRPVLNASDTVVVNMSMSLNGIMDLAEKNQTLITQLWIYEEWIDEMLKWDPDMYKGISNIIMPSSKIWLPDIYIFNNADKGREGFIMAAKSRLSVGYEGKVEWVIPVIIRSSCEVDVTFFPFDNQKCFVRFGSWIYENTQLNLQLKHEEVDLRPYEKNTEFDLINISLKRELIDNGVFVGKSAQVILHLHIRRKSIYYSYTVIAPTLVLCILTLFSFFLPCDNGDKVGIGLTVFLSLYVLQLAIAENIPESNSLPLIGLFLTLVMTLNAISLVFATLVINMKKKGDRRSCRPVPEAVLKFCYKFLRTLTFTHLLDERELYGDCQKEEQTSSDIKDVITEEDSGASTSQAAGPSVEAVTDGRPVQRKRRRDSGSGDAVYTVLKTTESSPKAPVWNNPSNDPRLQWYFVAEVLDKCLFVLFLIAMVVTITSTLIIVPWVNRV